MSLRWRPRLARAARRDIEHILFWSAERFGDAQADRYRRLIAARIGKLVAGPDVPGSRRRDDLAPGLRSLHLTRGTSRSAHVLFYQPASDRIIRIVRILHQHMDPARHIHEQDEDP